MKDGGCRVPVMLVEGLAGRRDADNYQTSDRKEIKISQLREAEAESV
jgi:hypothetical protein